MRETLGPSIAQIVADEDDSRAKQEEPVTVNILLVFTLTVAATLNAWCLSAYL